MNKINYLAPEYMSYDDKLIQLFPEEAIEKPVKTITFQVTEDCCMACTYCYQNNKTKNKMNFETAKKFIDDLLDDKYFINSKNTFTVIFDFIGGEPLMEIELIGKIWDYIISSMIEKEHPWLLFTRMCISSNGLLYNTKEAQNFFNLYGNFCSYSISVDGNKKLHDSCRLDLNGNGTYDRVIDAVHKYNYKYGENPQTKMTIAPGNINYLSNAVFNLIDEKYTVIMLNCVFENVWEIEHATTLYNQLKIIADYLIENNLYNKIYVRMFSENFYKPMSEEQNTNWCGGVCEKSLAINHKGNLYPCLRYMESSLNNEQEPIVIGNVFNGYGKTLKDKQNIEKISNITRRSQSTDECFNCPIADGCAWCSAYNYEVFGTPNKRTTFTCCMHKAASLANVYYWNKLYKYLNINKVFKMHCPKEWALEIIDEKEYNYLKILSQEGEI